MQVRPDVYEGVRAGVLLFHRSGALAFYEDDRCHPDQLVIAYAPGQWLSVFPSDDD